MGLEEEFTKAMWSTMDAARAKNYTPTYFMRMLERYGGVETAKRLLADHTPQSGLSTLWELDLLPQSLEAVVIQDRYRSLFKPDEISEARRRLDELGYFAKQ
jgi:hypothetical protein